MRVGVVGYELEGERTGVGRYLESLLQGALELREDAEFVLFLQGDAFDHPLWADPGGPIRIRCDGRADQHVVVWEQLRLPKLIRREPLDVLFSPSYSLPGRPSLPSAVTIHDLSFLHRGEELGWKQRLRRRWLAKRAVHHADRILADTETVARELCTTYDLAPLRVGVVPIAVSAAFQPQPASEDPTHRQELGITGAYALFVGSLLPRRPLRPVLQAFARLLAARDADQPPLQLVVAGPNRLPRPENLDRWIADAGLARHVLRLGYVSDTALPALYRGAELVLYPSEYEGYGLPPLEALASGTPVLVGKGLALDDLWEGYPYLAESLDEAGLFAALDRALNDPQRAAVGREGADRVRSLSTSSCAQQWLDQLRLAQRTHRSGT